LKIGHISVIHKNGKKDEYENYRGITLLNFLVDYMKNYKTFFGTGIFPDRNRRTSRI